MKNKEKTLKIITALTAVLVAVKELMNVFKKEKK